MHTLFRVGYHSSCSCSQMIFATGLRGHHVPKAVVQGQCHDTACVCATQQEMQCVQLLSRLRETDRRLSCVTNSPVQVSHSQKVCLQ